MAWQITVPDYKTKNRTSLKLISINDVLQQCSLNKYEHSRPHSRQTDLKYDYIKLTV